MEPLSRFIVGQVRCAACGRSSEQVRWRVLDAVERPDLVARLDSVLISVCQHCDHSERLPAPVFLLRWASAAPFLLIVPDGADGVPEEFQAEVGSSIAQILNSAANAGTALPRLPVMVVPSVLSGLPPAELDNLLERRLEDGSLPDDHGRRTFVLLIEDGQYDQLAWETLGRLIESRSLDELRAARTGEVWNSPEQVARMVEQIDDLGLPPAAGAALVALIESPNDDLPGALQNYHAALGALVAPERSDVLFRTATDELADVETRKAAAEEGRRIAAAGDNPVGEALFIGIFVALCRSDATGRPTLQRRLLELQRRAVGLSEGRSEVDLAVRLKSNLAGMLAEATLPDTVDRLTETRRLLLELIETAESVGDAALSALHRSNRALAGLRLWRAAPDGGGSLEEALTNADRAVAARIRLGVSLDLAYSYSHRGVIQLEIAIHAQDADRARGAVEDFTEALARCGPQDDPELYATCSSDLAIAQIHLGALSDAGPGDPLWASAYQHAAVIADNESLSDALRGRAKASMAEALASSSPDSPEIIAHLQQSCSLLTLTNDPQRLQWVAGALGDRYARAGRWEEAAASFEQALDAENFRADFGGESAPTGPSPLALGRTHGPVGRWAAYALAKSGDLRQAVEVLEANLCRTIGQGHRARQADLSIVRQTSPDMAAQFVELSEALRECLDDDQHPALRRELMALITRIRSQVLPSFLRQQPLSKITETLDRRHPLVYLLTAPEESVALIVTGSAETDVSAVWADGIGSRYLAEQTFGRNQSLLFAQSRDQCIAALDSMLPILGVELMGPLAAHLTASEAETVALIPTGSLSRWPLHAAPFARQNPQASGDPTEPVCLWESMPVRYLPAGIYNIDPAAIRSRLRATRSLVGLADPVGDWTDLPGSRFELEGIFDVYQGEAQVVFGTGATRRFLLDHLTGGVDIHLSCHATGNQADHGGAVLHLSDGDLKFADIDRGGEWDLGVVAAAACSSGASDLAIAPDEAMNLASAFLNAGAIGVLTSLWQIADRATALLLRQFYVNTQTALMDPADALRSAALWLRSCDAAEASHHARQISGDRSPVLQPAASTDRRTGPRLPYAHPYYWACLIYTGSSMQSLASAEWEDVAGD